MEDIDNWEKLTNEQVGVYLSDKMDSINVSQYADGTDARYQYETGVQNKNPHEYIGKIKHKYQDIHRNPLSTFSRNAWNGLTQLPEGIAEEAVNLGELLDVKLLRAFGGDEEFEKRLNSGATALRQKLKNWFDEYRFENPERIKENKFIADLGQGAGSLFAALGLTLATKSPNAAASVFGLSQAGNLTSEMRDRGVDIDRANKVGLIGGAIEGELEKVGLHLWIENYATKKIGTFLAKQGLVEFTQEASQTAAEETLMRGFGERKDNKTIADVAKDVVYSGILGGILGIGGGAVSIPGTQAFKNRATNTLVENGMTEEQANSLVNERIYGTPKQQQELLNIVNESAKEIQIRNAKNKLMELGVKESKAQEMANDLVVTPQEMGEDLVQTLNKEADNDTLLNSSYEDDVKAFTEAQNVDIVAEAFDIKQELKDRFMTEGGVQEDEAEAAATLVENFTRTIYNETGETPREYMERKGLNILDERYPADEDEVIDESELTEEEIARLDAKEQARMEEEDIPFFQESLDIARENEKLDAENPAYEGETINIDGQERPVYNSVGAKIAQSEAALRNFYNWFGDSKVVDEQGRPLVVYHGSNTQFDTFDINKIGKYGESIGHGFYFGTKNIAEKYNKGYMYPVYLRMENPIDYLDSGIMDSQKDKIEDIADWFNDNYIETEDGHRLFVDNLEYSLKRHKTDAGFISDMLDFAEFNELDKGKAEVYQDIYKKIKEVFGVDGFTQETESGKIFVAFNPNQIKSTSNRGTYSESENNIYYQFAGENAQTAALDELDRAKQLEADGVDNEEIRQQTGWFKGVDGKWRFEISDKDADFNEGYNIDKWKENGTYFEGLNFKLGKILKHDKLFSAYPELKNVNIEFENRRTDDGTLGSFVKAENKIYLSNQLNSKKALSVIMHELQHVIQHKEGFASGGSLETKDVLEEKYKEIIEKYDYSPEMQALERDLDRYEFLYDIVNTLEVAENPQKIINKNWYKEKVFGTPKGKYRKSFIEEKAQQFIDEIREKYLSKSSWYYSQYLEYVQDGKLKEIKKEMNALGKSTWRRMKKKKPSEYTDAKSFLWELENSGGYDIYRRLAGEIEARNTQARMELTEEERRAKTPESTQDIKNADAIVVFDDGTAMAYEPETYYQSESQENLIMTHSAKLDNLDDIIKSESLVAPSMAIENNNKESLDKLGYSFGDVIFVRNPESIDYKNDNIYDRDIYSPRMPSPTYKTREGYISSYEYDSMKREWEYDKEKFKKNHDGLTFDEYFAGAEKYIFKGFTPSGTRKYVPYTAENALAEMKKQGLKGGENFNYGLSSFLAKLAKKQKSKEQLKKTADELGIVDIKTYDALREKYSDFEDKLREYAKDDYKGYEMFDDIYPDVMVALATGKTKDLNEYMDMPKLRKENPELLQQVNDFIIEAVTTKRSYFEAKPMRLLDLNEFSAVLVPENVTKEQRQGLERLGLEVIDYKRGHASEALQNVKGKIFFQRGNKVKRGSYNPKTRVINLFKKANRSTLIHELGHVFTMDYVKILEESGQTDKLTGFYEWLGINDISEATTETWEKMARGFETYIMEGQAPNVSTQNLFDRLRQWLVGVYQDLKGKVIPPEEINNDVREFFDRMLAQDEEMPDITNLKGKTEDILKVIQAAQKGESISVNGLTIDDVKKLVKASKTRLPRKPKTLEQEIRAAGGIDIQLAKSLGIYDEKKGNRNGFFKKDGAIKREDSLIEFLQESGYLEQGETETYEQTAELQDKAIELVEKADRTYTPENQQKIDLREQLEAIASEAMAELSEKGIKEKELFTALKTIKSVNLQAVSKDELKYLKSQLKSLEKDYKKFMKNTLRNQRKDFTQKQNEMLDFIKAMPLTGDDKLKLLARVKKAKFIDDFNKVARDVFNKGRELYENEQKKLYVSMIKKEIRKSKPTEVTKQRYDYENNRLFADLRKWNNLTQAQAQDELAKIEVKDDKTETDLIRIRFLNYKANGMDSSVELMEEVYNDIINAKEAGKLAKGDIDVSKAVNRELLKRDVLDAISQNDANKETFKTKFTNLYRRGLTNLYSMLNSIASKEIADRFEMETVINNAEIRTFKHIENLTNEILNVLNLKSKGQLLDRLADMGQIIDNITDTEGRVRELSKLHIMDIYNAIKNEKTRENYILAYGEEQLARVLRYLTPQDMMLADILMEDVNTLYPETNKVYIENYGMDLKKVENYWMATSEHHEDTDLLGESMMQQTVPSFLKERVKGSVVPIPKNAWSKYLKHTKQSIYLINTANKYKELADTFKSSRVKNAIQTKFGDGVYNELRTQIDRLSLNGINDDLNYLETAFGAVLNNFVVAKIAVAPTVFVGQLTSITNYSESIKTGQFYKYFAEGLSHPKKTIQYMKKVSGDFLESRYKGGYSEAVSRVLSEAESVSKKKFRALSVGTKYNVVNALTSWVRMGDIGAIIFGGYAQIQSNLENGMSLEDAEKKFEFDTLRSQQSSNVASLSSFQQSKGFARIFLAFKNTQHQYLRKLADALINYERGEISSQQMAKTVLNYAVVQTSLYVIAKNITKAALGLSGDDDDLTDGVIEQILVGSLDAIPILSDLLRYTYKRLTKQYAGGIVNMPGVDDIEKAINKLAKDKKDVYDYIDIISPLIEGTTSLPIQRFKGMLKKYIE